MKRLLDALWKEQTGGSLVEYALLLGLVLFGAVLGVRTLSHSVKGTLTGAVSSMTTQSGNALSAGSAVFTEPGGNRRLSPKSGTPAAPSVELSQLVSWMQATAAESASGFRMEYSDALAASDDGLKAAKAWWFHHAPGGNFASAPVVRGGENISTARVKGGIAAPVTKP